LWISERGHFGVLVGDLAGLVDHERPALLGDAASELLILVVDLLFDLLFAGVVATPKALATSPLSSASR